jgi:hypothetical protein
LLPSSGSKIMTSEKPEEAYIADYIEAMEKAGIAQSV